MTNDLYSAVRPPAMTRRAALRRAGAGFGALAFAALAHEQQAQAGTPASGTGAGRPFHHTPRAKRVVHLFPQGGVSQMDTFDPKPQMAKWDGKPQPGREPKPGSNVGTIWHSPFAFKKHGQSGLEISELFPNVAGFADDLCVIRSMHTVNTDHATMAHMMCVGDPRQSRPSLGAWTVYGLGAENENLPAFVVLCPDGKPLGGAALWQSAFMPSGFQGSFVDTSGSARRADELIQHLRSPHAHPRDQRRQLDLLKAMNAGHAAARGHDTLLDGRLEAFELAYRMQSEATDAFDLHREPQSVIDAYGDTPIGRQFLLCRRLLERGVRYVQLLDGDIAPWDQHDHLVKDHGKLARDTDRPTAAMFADLKRLGMFDDTLIFWAGEFGRTATSEINPGQTMKTAGRDHNAGFTAWLAGGGVKGGTAYGTTDDFGVTPVENPVHVHDLHATILHLLGFDHEKLTYRYAGRDFRLTDVHGTVAADVLA